MKTRTKFVIAAFAAIVAYVIAETLLLITQGVGYPPEVTYCWFTAWTVELCALAGIKITDERRTPYKVEAEIAE